MLCLYWCQSSWILGSILCKPLSFQIIPQIYPSFLKDLTLSSFLLECDVHWIAKYSEMDDFWFLVGKDFFRCLLLDYSVWSTVLYIHRCYGSLCPYMHGNILIMKHSPCSFHDHSILPFCNPILLWIICSGQLPLSPWISA